MVIGNHSFGNVAAGSEPPIQRLEISILYVMTLKKAYCSDHVERSMTVLRQWSSRNDDAESHIVNGDGQSLVWVCGGGITGLRVRHGIVDERGKHGV